MYKMHLPIELINKIFTYMSSPCAPLIKQYWKHRRIIDFYDMITYDSEFVKELIAWNDFIALHNINIDY